MCLTLNKIIFMHSYSLCVCVCVCVCVCENEESLPCIIPTYMCFLIEECLQRTIWITTAHTVRIKQTWCPAATATVGALLTALDMQQTTTLIWREKLKMEQEWQHACLPEGLSLGEHIWGFKTTGFCSVLF